MRTVRLLPPCLILLLLALLPLMASAQAELSRQVFTSAAVQCSTGTYQLVGTLGGTIMRAAEPNPGFTMIQGFWNAWSQSSTGVQSGSSERWRFAMRQNQPNPFKPTTTIHFVVSDRITTLTRLAVYDVTGRLVKTLVNTTLTPGLQAVVWDGSDENHRPVAAGVYFALLQSGSQSAKKQLVLLK